MWHIPAASRIISMTDPTSCEPFTSHHSELWKQYILVSPRPEVNGPAASQLLASSPSKGWVSVSSACNEPQRPEDSDWHWLQSTTEGFFEKGKVLGKSYGMEA